MFATHFATTLQKLAVEETRKGNKLTPATPSGLEVIYYKLKIVLEITTLNQGNSSVLGISMNTKSATYNVFQADPLYQQNHSVKIASVYQFPETYVRLQQATPTLQS